MPPRRCLPSPGPMWMMASGTVGSRVARSVGVGRAAPARVLPGTCFVPLLFVVLALALLFFILGFGLTLAHLPCSAWRDHMRGSDCPCTGIGVQKPTPLFVHQQRGAAPPLSFPPLSPYLSSPTPTWKVSQGKTEAQDNQSNAKAKTTKGRGTQ